MMCGRARRGPRGEVDMRGRSEGPTGRGLGTVWGGAWEAAGGGEDSPRHVTFFSER